MTKHPHLLHEAPVTWRLDPQTRELGRRGVARARAALAEAARREEASLPRPPAPALDHAAKPVTKPAERAAEHRSAA